MEKKKYKKEYIGSAWNKSFTYTDKDTGRSVTKDYLSVAFKGKGELDKVEVVLRDKATGQEVLLSNFMVQVEDVYKKKSDKAPDKDIVVLTLED